MSGDPVPAVPPPSVIGPLTRTDIVRYQGASGDMYKIHHDEEYARAAGLAGPISVGMLQAGFLASWATSWLGAANLRRLRTRFKKPVSPGDVLTCSGTVVKVYEEDGERKVDIELACTRQTGGLAVEGSATFVLPGRS